MKVEFSPPDVTELEIQEVADAAAIRMDNHRKKDEAI